ncbi:IclR family transcriptional regulator [Sodalis praecaptivus]|uniref:HTH-type transcriptional repressor AllR n=1 Tax=Sodalis praecaptivus TaxID=1239307 RepID=W0HPJ4_9GAMM|nr:IclR family transcriptional regulator [Sodalis praecaptivus]AHF75781.1 IclR family transcriptional regulator [Sodalis praecaptivus]
MSQKETEAEASYRIDAVDCALDVLMIVSSDPHLGLSEIARKLGASRQRIFRMLRNLEARGMIERSRDGKTFHLGYQSLLIGNAARAQIDLVCLAEPILREVGLQVAETVQLRIRDGLETMCIASWEPEREIRVNAIIGRRRPLHTGSSKIFLAFMPEEERERYLSTALAAYTANTLTDQSTLRARLADIRQQHYNVSRGEVSDDLLSISAPVFAAEQRVVATMSISAPAARVVKDNIDTWAALVVQAAGRLSQMLGYARAG